MVSKYSIVLLHFRFEMKLDKTVAIPGNGQKMPDKFGDMGGKRHFPKSRQYPLISTHWSPEAFRALPSGHFLSTSFEAAWFCLFRLTIEDERKNFKVIRGSSKSYALSAIPKSKWHESLLSVQSEVENTFRNHFSE